MKSTNAQHVSAVAAKTANRSSFILLFALALASGQLFSFGARAESLGFSIHDGVTSQLTVEVSDDLTGLPIADATIQATDCITGHCFNVTVSGDGYATTTVLGVSGTHLEIFLKPLAPTPVVVSGQVGGWRDLPTDPVRASQIHVGLVFRALNIFDLLHFDLSGIVSPLKDSIDVIGQHDIPSNLVMPRQSVWTIIGPITLNKPAYRLPLSPAAATRLTALQGDIAVGDVTSIIQGGKLKPSAVNKLNFSKFGLTPAFSPVSGGNVGVNADKTLSATHQVSVQSPSFSADVIVAAVTDVDGDRQTLVPTDIKAISATTSSTRGGGGGAGDGRGPGGTVTLKSCAGPSCGQVKSVVTLAMVGQGERICGIINSPAGATVTPGPYLCTDSLGNGAAPLPASLKLQAGPQGIATGVFEAETGTGDQLRSYPIWYVYALPAAGESHVEPTTFPGRERIRSYSVMKLEFEGGVDEHSLDGKAMMTRLKRFGRSMARVSP